MPESCLCRFHPPTARCLSYPHIVYTELQISIGDAYIRLSQLIISVTNLNILYIPKYQFAFELKGFLFQTAVSLAKQFLFSGALQPRKPVTVSSDENIQTQACQLVPTDNLSKEVKTSGENGFNQLQVENPSTS